MAVIRTVLSDAVCWSKDSDGLGHSNQMEQQMSDGVKDIGFDKLDKKYR